MAVDALADLELDARALREVAPTHTTIRHGALGAPGGAVSVTDLARPGLCVPRKVLDAAVRARALQAGSRAEQHHVRDATADAALRAFDLIVDARGANIGTPNAVGLRTYWTVPTSAVDDD